MAILNSLGIKAKPLISYKERHQRVIVNVNDTKYNRINITNNLMERMIKFEKSSFNAKKEL